MNDDKLERSLRELDANLNTLPKESLPARDLWPAIEAKMTAKSGFGRQSIGLAASLSVAVIIGGWFWLGGSQTNDAHQLPTANEAAPSTNVAAIAPLEIQRSRMQFAFYPGDKYFTARDRALNELEQRLASLSPAQKNLILSNLHAIETALQEIDTALAENPDNSLLKQLLLNTYQQELNAILTMSRTADHMRTSL